VPLKFHCHVNILLHQPPPPPPNHPADVNKTQLLTSQNQAFNHLSLGYHARQTALNLCIDMVLCVWRSLQCWENITIMLDWGESWQPLFHPCALESGRTLEANCFTPRTNSARDEFQLIRRWRVSGITLFPGMFSKWVVLIQCTRESWLLNASLLV
jgi:hypothetical protein